MPPGDVLPFLCPQLRESVLSAVTNARFTSSASGADSIYTVRVYSVLIPRYELKVLGAVTAF